MDSPLIQSALGVATVFVLWRILRPRSGPPLPPGPRGLPVLGNLLDVPLNKEFWVTFKEWSDKWGDVVHMNIVGRHFIILNTMDATKDILEKRGKIYSARASVTMFEIAEHDKLMAVETNTKRWADGRKLVMQFLTGKELDKLWPIVEEECSKLLGKIYKDPSQLGHLLEMSIVCIIMRSTYGYTPDEHDDKFTHITFQLLDEMLVAARPTNILNIFPALRHLPSWLPGMSNKRLALKFRETMHRVVKEPFEWAMNNKDNPDVTRSLCHRFQNSGLDVGNRDLAEWTAAVQFVAGADTTTFTLHAVIKALMLYPEVQKKAQQQLDKVLGHRLPTMADRPDLPYIDAIMREVARWHLLGPFGAPHSSDADDVYNGYFIPKGSIILPNTGAIASNPDIYPDPDNFVPDRYIPDDKGNTQLDPTNYTFGFGRRVCPGKALAQAEVFLHIAMILKVYDILPWKNDKDGVKIVIGENRPPSMDMPRRPAQYACALKLRSQDCLELFEEP